MGGNAENLWIAIANRDFIIQNDVAMASSILCATIMGVLL